MSFKGLISVAGGIRWKVTEALCSNNVLVVGFPLRNAIVFYLQALLIIDQVFVVACWGLGRVEPWL